MSSGTSIAFLILLATLGLSIWAIVDAVRTPTEEFRLARSSKGMWITLIAVFTLFTGIVGSILAIVYLVSIRPRVRATRVQ